MFYEVRGIIHIEDLIIVDCYITIGDTEYARPFAITSDDPEIYEPEIEAYMQQVEANPAAYLEGYNG